MFAFRTQREPKWTVPILHSQPTIIFPARPRWTFAARVLTGISAGRRSSVIFLANRRLTLHVPSRRAPSRPLFGQSPKELHSRET